MRDDQLARGLVAPFEASLAIRGKRFHNRKYGEICLRGAAEDVRRRWARRALLSFPEGHLLHAYFGSTLVGFPLPANLPPDAVPERPMVCEVVIGDMSVGEQVADLHAQTSGEPVEMENGHVPHTAFNA